MTYWPKKRWVKKKDIEKHFEDPSISKAQKTHTIKQQIPITKKQSMVKELKLIKQKKPL